MHRQKGLRHNFCTTAAESPAATVSLLDARSLCRRGLWYIASRQAWGGRQWNSLPARARSQNLADGDGGIRRAKAKNPSYRSDDAGNSIRTTKDTNSILGNDFPLPLGNFLRKPRMQLASCL